MRQFLSLFLFAILLSGCGGKPVETVTVAVAVPPEPKPIPNICRANSRREFPDVKKQKGGTPPENTEHAYITARKRDAENALGATSCECWIVDAVGSEQDKQAAKPFCDTKPAPKGATS